MKYIVSNKGPLKGKVRIKGAKNSVLPILAASLLAHGESIIDDVPQLYDVSIMCDILNELGVKILRENNDGTIKIISNDNINTCAPYELVSKMRASFLVMGPVLAKKGYVKISVPGGCAIGSRPVDLHLKGFSAMGAKITQKNGYIEARIDGKLNGSRIYLDFPSVGATENIMMAAAIANGKTIIENAAIEPEIVDLATYLTSMGADIKGAGTDTIKIIGVDELVGKRHAVIPDRIEAGTFMVAAAITGGEITVENVVSDHLKPIVAKLRECGVEISEELSTIHLSAKKGLKSIDIKTLPYPGFPTDMQAQMTSLMCRASGTSMVIETVFENRFMHLSELKRMGAEVKVEGRSAIIQGKERLTGADVKATDLRAGAALVIAALAARGTSEIDDIEHIERGYVELHTRLNELGANIKKV